MLGALALVTFILTSCSNSPAHVSTSGSSSTTTSVLTPALTTPTVDLGGHTYAVPTEDGVHAIDPSVATGGQIVLTDQGFLPHRLFVQLGQKITWTNLSSHPVRITFLHLPVKSGLIPVGGTFTYSSPTLINFEYGSSSRYHGLVAIGAFAP
jgi:plastocyanin